MAIDFPNSPSDNDIYTVNGKRWIYSSGKWSIYGSTPIDSLNVDSGLLFTDTTNNRVGVNNTSPTVDLDVTGDVSISGNLAVGLNTDVEASIDAVESDVSTLQTDVTNINELQFSYQTASYTLVLSDAGKAVQMAVASANNLTVPPNSSVAFPVGTQILVIQQGGGQTTIAAGAGVTLYSKDSNLKLSAQWCAATLIKANTDTWVIVGDLSA
jgi:hypothetical protein